MKIIPPYRVSFSLLPLAVCAAALLAAPHASAVPVSGAMGAGVAVDLYPVGSFSGTGTSNSSWLTTPTSLSVSASRTVTNSSTSSISAYANGTATWAANGNSGTATFNYGWTIHDGGDYPFVSAQTGLNLPNWTYTFTADSSGLFSMNYNVTAPGGLPLYGAGLQNFTIGTNGGNVLTLSNVGSGTYTQAVTAGSTYTVYFQNYGAIYDGLSNVGVQASFNWTLPGATISNPGGNSVPDAGSSVLMLLIGAVSLASFASRLKFEV